MKRARARKTASNAGKRYQSLSEGFLQAAGYIHLPDGSWCHPWALERVCGPSSINNHQQQTNHANTTQSSQSRSSTHHPLDAGLHDTQPKRRHRPALVGVDKGKTQGQGCFEVRITRYGGRLLDEDNFHGGCKALIDELRYAGLIPDDNPASISLRYEQRVVGRSEWGTLVQIKKKDNKKTKNA